MKEEHEFVIVDSADQECNDHNIVNFAHHVDMSKENCRLQEEIDSLAKVKIDQEAEIRRLREAISALAKYNQSVDNDETPYQSKFASEFDVKRIIGGEGEGRFGTVVFECVSRLTKASIAVKRIQTVNPRYFSNRFFKVNNSLSKEVLSRALREIRATAHFDQPGIIRYNSTWIEKPPLGWQNEADMEMLGKIGTFRTCLNMNYVEESLFMYTEMQLCENSLADWLELNQTRRNIEDMKDYFPQILSALDFIHDRGIIHRNLKPSNILFIPPTSKFSPGQLKISDLGIVADRVVKSGEEVAQIQLFPRETQMYMAPEQKDDGYSSKVDIFALSLLLIELSVVITKSEAELIFNDYREGKPNNTLDHLPDTKNFVAWLTNLNPDERPDCKEILDHRFLETPVIEL
ncbi:hypothetical protein PRIPAC_71174 [Pristionchus pacificus]|uniref:Protein kinase domain-containing protein n=1 Tax=Pristionchus pacificus TaxID=54126 RepID=A0A2A6C197_PRIPA|nr:hypothetical protein PRIPAC_71174 [Pristionchus pacificus]|eukprot:PDM71886.1 protein kinase [Pristionchus pacificus]